MFRGLKNTKKSLPKQTFCLSGGKRIRTADPLHAMQVLYQLSYTPLDEDQCNIPLKKMSRINPRLTYYFFIFAPFMICSLLVSGCKPEKQGSPENTLRHDFQLENVIQTLNNPPLEQENYSHTPQAYTLLDTFKSSDKSQNLHRHYYLSTVSNLNIETLESLMTKNTESVHWIYLTKQQSALFSSRDRAFDRFVHCINQTRPVQNLSKTLWFKTAYLYKGPTFTCELSYIP
jgi:hypothetical protein